MTDNERPSTPEAIEQRRSLLFGQYQSACAAIAMLSLYELATTIREAFPDTVVLVFGDGENRCLDFQHAEDTHGQIVADADQVDDAGIEAATICSNIGTDDIGRDTWIRYAPYERWQNTYRCPVDPILGLPGDLLSTPATTCLDELTQLREQVGQLEQFAMRPS